jgi:hypothetical protein
VVFPVFIAIGGKAGKLNIEIMSLRWKQYFLTMLTGHDRPWLGAPDMRTRFAVAEDEWAGSVRHPNYEMVYYHPASAS